MTLIWRPKLFVAQAGRRQSAARLASSGWLPDGEPSLSLWLDASDRSTRFDSDSGGSLQLTHGGAVGRLQDKSPAARHFTQSVAGDRPTLGASGGDLVNGLETLVFDWAVADNVAGSKSLNSGAVATNVFVPTGTTAGTHDHAIFLVHQRINAANDRRLLADQNSGYQIKNGTTATTAQWLITGLANTELITGLATGVTYILLARRLAGLETRLSFGGGTELVQSNAGAIGNALSGALHLPGHQTNHFKQKIRLCEMICFTGARLSTAVLNNCGRYLAAKWGAGWSALA
jgi:hypothetical protein